MYSKEPERDEAKPGETPKVKLRLPKFGCFSLFFIFFFATFLLGMLIFQTTLSRPVVCETPDPGEPVVVYDPCGVLLKEEVKPLHDLAAEVAKAGDCNVAVMFVDEHFTNFRTLYDAVLADWKPDKGVLLMFGLNHGSVRMSITGDGWRLASWDQRKWREDVLNRVACYRGEAARILLTEFKRSIETARTGDLPEAEMGKFSGTFFSAGQSQEREQYTAGICGAIAGAGALLIGWLLLRNGKSIIRTRPAHNRAVQEEFDEKSPENPKLELRDATGSNRKPFLGCLHHPALKIIAIASGTLIGFGGMATVWTEDPDPDSGSKADFGELVFKADDRIPAAPSGVVSDLANVFSEEEEQMLARAVRELESATGGQVRILTVQTIGGAPLEEYTLGVASKWKIGHAGKDDGALVFFAIQDHRSRIEVGYGWEELLNDARCGDLLRAIVPEMRAEKYAEGCAKVIRGMEEYLTGEQARADEDGVRKASETKQPKNTILVYPPVIHAAPSYDPRAPNPIDAFLGLLGVVSLLLGVWMGYRGRTLATALPLYYIYDPDEYHGSGGSSYDSSDYGSSDYGSSSSDSGGGGSFGGGGASGSW